MEQLAQFVNKSFEFNLTNNRVNNLFNSMTSARIQKLTEATNSILVNPSNRLGRSSVDNCADNDNEESMDIDITDISVAEDSSYEDETIVAKPLSLVKIRALEPKEVVAVAVASCENVRKTEANKPKNWLISDLVVSDEHSEGNLRTHKCLVSSFNHECKLFCVERNPKNHISIH